MLKRSLFLCAILVAICCTSRKDRAFEDNVDPADTICITEIKRARSDIEKNRLTYCHYAGSVVTVNLRAQKEMDSLLKLFNIGYEEERSPCIIVENLTYHCYCAIMQDAITKKYGGKLIDSLLSLADSLYISRHLMDTFDNNSEETRWDKPPLFPGDSMDDPMNHSGLQKAFDDTVHYPSGYKYREPGGGNAMAGMQVLLIIDQKGKATVKDVQFLFGDNNARTLDGNEMHYGYLRKTAVSLIERTRWTPAKIKSHNVASANDIFISLK